MSIITANTKIGRVVQIEGLVQEMNEIESQLYDQYNAID
jgi:hypothetical protein